jgi:hypothetical protein
MAPRVIELCFQTAGLWEMMAHRRMGLPLHVDRVCFYRPPEGAEGRVYAVVTPGADRKSFDAEVVDPSGNRYLELHGYRTVVFRELQDFEVLQGQHAATA